MLTKLNNVCTYEVGTLAVDGWAVTFGTATVSEEGTGWAAAPPSPLRCTKCNSTAINGQCTNRCYDGPLLGGFNVAIKGLTSVLIPT